MKFINKLKCRIYGHVYDYDWTKYYSQLVAHNYIITCKRCGQKWELKDQFKTRKD
jgi:hypothetical protein